MIAEKNEVTIPSQHNEDRKKKTKTCTMENKLLGPTAAAKLLGISISQLERYGWKKLIPSVKTPRGQWRAWTRDILEFREGMKSISNKKH